MVGGEWDGARRCVRGDHGRFGFVCCVGGVVVRRLCCLHAREASSALGTAWGRRGVVGVGARVVTLKTR